MIIEWVDPNTLIPHPKNPNHHSAAQVERLAQLISYQGWRLPIIVSKRSGYIVSGHGRLQAAIKAGDTEVPVSLQDFQDDESEYAFLVSDNSIASWAVLDVGAVNLEVTHLGPDFDLIHLGLKDFTIDCEKEQQRDEEQAEKSCPHCGGTLGK